MAAPPEDPITQLERLGALKAQGLLLPYTPIEFKALRNPLPDYDGSFTAVRLGTLGIAYNTRIIKEAPKTWQDLQKPAFKGAYGIANPALSGTAYMSVAVLYDDPDLVPECLFEAARAFRQAGDAAGAAGGYGGRLSTSISRSLLNRS